MSDSLSSELPRPLYDDWPLGQRAAAQALWDWHSGLLRAQPFGRNGAPDASDDFYEEEKQRVVDGEPPHLLREDIWRPAYNVCQKHDLSRGLLAAQVVGLRGLQGRVRFDTGTDLNEFLRLWIIPLARLLGGLAGVDQKWHLSKIDELGRGFFFVGRLVQLPEDLEQDKLFFPLEDLKQVNVSIEQLREGRIDENVRRLMWKQSIRARDALGQGQALIRDLPSRRLRFAVKRWWLGALELLSLVERNEYDVWNQRPELSILHKIRVYLQAFFGKATSR